MTCGPAVLDAEAAANGVPVAVVGEHEERVRKLAKQAARDELAQREALVERRLGLRACAVGEGGLDPVRRVDRLAGAGGVEHGARELVVGEGQVEVDRREPGGEDEPLELGRAPRHRGEARRIALDSLEPAGRMVFVGAAQVLEAELVLDRDHEHPVVGEAAPRELEVRAGGAGRVVAELRVVEVAVLEDA